MRKRIWNSFLLKDKRGLDAVVTTLLIILLSIVAIGIIWVVVKNVISDGASDINLDKFTFDLVIKGAYIDGSEVDVNVRRSVGGGDLVGIKFIFSDGSSSNSVERMISLEELGQNLFTFNDTEVGGISTVETVSVAPIYISSDQETVGEITDTADIGSTPPPGGSGGSGGIGGSGGSGGSGGNGSGGNGSGGSGGAICGNTFCEVGENAGNCPADCDVPSSCNGVWEGVSEDAGVTCDGNSNGCNAGCTCNAGFTANGLGSCTLDPAIDVGAIFSVWNSIYFDSNNLPKSGSVTGYIGNYVNFTGSPETGCFLITFADYVPENDISYLRLDDELLGAPNIAAGQTYNVWEADNCGQ